jgi:3'-5' exoribonuclease
MGKMLRNAPINEWEASDTVQGFALLTRKELRQDRNGKSYLDLELCDQTGRISAKIWADSPAINSQFESHQFIAFKGSVKSFKDALQLSIDECRLATDEDRRFGFDETLLIPSTREDIDDLWQRLQGLIDLVLRPVLHRLGVETLVAYGPQLREHPAAKSIHHAYRGGLLEHVVSMAELGVALCSHYRELDRDLVLVGALFHDLGKLQELGAMPRNDYTLEGRLVGHVVLGRDLLRDRCAAIPDFPSDLRLLLEHLVLSHQGKKEFSSPVEPMTAEALALHFLDDLDSKMNQLRAARDANPGINFHRGLQRFVYLPATEEPPDGSTPLPPNSEIANTGTVPIQSETPLNEPNPSGEQRLPFAGLYRRISLDNK